MLLQAVTGAALAPLAPLLPTVFFVCSTDVVPGVRRIQTATGLPTAQLHSCTSMLAEPLLAPVATVELGCVRIAVPALLHNLLAVLPQLAGITTP